MPSSRKSTPKVGNTGAQYKWTKEASEFSYYDMEVPKDSDIVKWESGARWRVLE